MHARRRSIPALGRSLAVVLVGIVAALLVAGGPASAAPATQAAPQACVHPPQRNDNSIHIQGCMIDQRKTPATPVSGVKISVADDTGTVIGRDTSNAGGSFDIPLPGPSINNLGKTFTVRIDKASLPKGAALRNPKQVSLKVTPKIDSDIFVTFPIGKAGAGETSIAVQVLQLAVTGLVFGLILAMASLGLSMIFGTTGLTNFAHGELITFGALVAYGVDSLPGDIKIAGVNVTLAVAMVVAIVVSGIFGWVNDRALWRPLRKRHTGLIAMMVVSIGLSVFLRNIYQYLVGASNHQYSQFSSPEPYHWGPVLVTPKDIFVVLFSVLVLVLVVVALQRTRVGKATRAVADNTALSAATGINVDRVISVVWIVGTALAGLSGVLFGMTEGFDYQVGFKILLLVFAAVVLGGLGTAWGAIVGALVIGIFVDVSTVVVPPELKFVGALVVLIIVLLIRPQGILGRSQRVG
jgi:branched-subunit amino acid ABC-type transport system permease component